MTYYSGSFRQRGHGLGNIFGVLSRVAMPILRRTLVPSLKRQGARVARKYIPKVIDAGVGLLSDVAQKRPLGRAIRARASQVFDGPIKARRPIKRRQSRAGSRIRTTAKRSKKVHKKDIFS